MQATKNLTTNAAGNTTSAPSHERELEAAIGRIEGAAFALGIITDALAGNSTDVAALAALDYLSDELKDNVHALWVVSGEFIKACPAPALQPDAAIALP